MKPRKLDSQLFKCLVFHWEGSNYPSLEFKQVNDKENIWSARVGIGWRALGRVTSNQTIVWFWIGSHAEYDKLLNKP